MQLHSTPALDPLDAALHEAAHAVVAAHLHLRFAYASIVPANDSAGRVKLNRISLRMRMFRSAGNDSYREITEAEIHAAKLKKAEDEIVMAYAGGFPERELVAELRGDSYDLKQIAEIASDHGISAERLNELKARCGEILALPEISDAINEIAHLLMTRGKLPASEVRAVYRFWRAWRTRTLGKIPAARQRG